MEDHKIIKEGKIFQIFIINQIFLYNKKSIRDMFNAHKHLAISEKDFLKTGKVLICVFDELGVD